MAWDDSMFASSLRSIGKLGIKMHDFFENSLEHSALTRAINPYLVLIAVMAALITNSLLMFLDQQSINLLRRGLWFLFIILMFTLLKKIYK